MLPNGPNTRRAIKEPSTASECSNGITVAPTPPPRVVSLRWRRLLSGPISNCHAHVNDLTASTSWLTHIINGSDAPKVSIYRNATTLLALLGCYGSFNTRFMEIIPDKYTVSVPEKNLPMVRIRSGFLSVPS